MLARGYPKGIPATVLIPCLSSKTILRVYLSPLEMSGHEVDFAHWPLPSPLLQYIYC